MSTSGAAGPEELAARFAACLASGDLEGILQLYAADAVVSLPRGREAADSHAIRSAFAAALRTGGVPGFDGLVEPRVVVAGGLAMTSCTGADGVVRTQVARCEPDGRWVWVRDGSMLRDVEAALPVDVPDVA